MRSGCLALRHSHRRSNAFLNLKNSCWNWQSGSGSRSPMWSCINCQGQIWTQMMATKTAATIGWCQNLLRSIKRSNKRGRSKLKRRGFGRKKKSRQVRGLGIKWRAMNKNSMNFCWTTKWILSWPICCRGLWCRVRKDGRRIAIVRKKFCRLRRIWQLGRGSAYWLSSKERVCQCLCIEMRYWQLWGTTRFWLLWERLAREKPLKFLSTYMKLGIQNLEK